MLFLILIVKYIFRFRPKMTGLFRFRLFFGRKRKCFFGYFYFTAEKVKFIFGRPLEDCLCCRMAWLHCICQPRPVTLKLSAVYCCLVLPLTYQTESVIMQCVTWGTCLGFVPFWIFVSYFFFIAKLQLTFVYFFLFFVRWNHLFGCIIYWSCIKKLFRYVTGICHIIVML